MTHRLTRPGRGSPHPYALPGGSHTQPSCSNEIGFSPLRMIKLKPASVGRPGGLEEHQANNTCPINQSPAVHPAGRTFDVYFSKAAPESRGSPWFCHFFGSILGVVCTLGLQLSLWQAGYSELWDRRRHRPFAPRSECCSSRLQIGVAQGSFLIASLICPHPGLA